MPMAYWSQCLKIFFRPKYHQYQTLSQTRASVFHQRDLCTSHSSGEETSPQTHPSMADQPSCTSVPSTGTGTSHNDLQNHDDITIQHARHIFDKAVDSVLPHEIIKRHLLFDQRTNVLSIKGRSYPLAHNVHVVGFGKAVLGMARAVEDVIGHHVIRGVVSVPVGAQEALRKSGKTDMILKPDSTVKVHEGAANNLPDEEAFDAAKEIKHVAESVDEGDLLLVLISGGGSALLPYPHIPLSLADILQVSKEMAKAGAGIKQLNYMRKQLEVLKGGGLASLAFPAKVVALILSDVIGDPLDLIASGPTVFDTSTSEDCLSLFTQLGIDRVAPKAIMDFLEQKQGAMQLQEASGSDAWGHVQNVIIGSNALACESAAETSKDLGYCSFILDTELDGEAKMVGSGFASLALYISALLNPCIYNIDLGSFKEDLINNFSFNVNRLNELLAKISGGENKNIAIISGGETIVNVKGSGTGGRNQEMALAAGIELDKMFLQALKFKATDAVAASSDTNEIQGERTREEHLNRGMFQPVSVVFLSGGTDGQDGPTPAAGGVVTLDFISQSSTSGFNAQKYLEENDSYSLLKSVDEGRYLLETGLTGTNVMDINLLLIRNIVAPVV